MKKLQRSATTKAAPLSAGVIYATAQLLIGTEGVEALSMRKLAAALDVTPMSLYHHVPNKAALLRGVTELTWSQFRTPDLEGRPWPERLRQLLGDFRSAALSQPKLAEYTLRGPEFLNSGDPFLLGLADVLNAAGLPEQEAPQVTAMVAAVVQGLLLTELNGAQDRRFTQWVDSVGADDSLRGVPGVRADRLFGLTLEVLIAGMEAKLPIMSPDGTDTGPQ